MRQMLACGICFLLTGQRYEHLLSDAILKNNDFHSIDSVWKNCGQWKAGFSGRWMGNIAR